jgi:hypothetical protein
MTEIYLLVLNDKRSTKIIASDKVKRQTLIRITIVKNYFGFLKILNVNANSHR